MFREYVIIIITIILPYFASFLRKGNKILFLQLVRLMNNIVTIAWLLLSIDITSKIYRKSSRRSRTSQSIDPSLWYVLELLNARIHVYILRKYFQL